MPLRNTGSLDAVRDDRWLAQLKILGVRSTRAAGDSNTALRLRCVALPFAFMTEAPHLLGGVAR